MPSIRILPPHLRNVIAAGEVIERPASVVKELIENSIDAGAQDIKIEVLYGGKKLIRVSDDGCGMDKENALLSIERYATSKLSRIEDLFRLHTLGFRGEALASIASVSRLTIETGTDKTSPATLLEVAGGVVKQIKEVSPLKGTIVTVRDLFFNTPARRKFLKANSTELNHILEVVISEGLSEYKRGYRLMADEKEVLILLPARKPLERVQQVFAIASEHLVEFEAVYESMKLHAFISRPPEIRSKRAGQYIFINRRPVRDHIITKAVYEGLLDIIPKDRHPLFVIYLEIEPSKVDFNVHPSKREVKFSEGSIVYEFIKRTVKEHMEVLSVPLNQLPLHSVPATTLASTTVACATKYEPVSEANIDTMMIFEGIKSDYDAFSGEVTVGESRSATQYLVFGNLFLAIPDKDGLIIIDKHAAHERVLYERFINGSITTKRLLFPGQVHLQTLYYRIILGLKDFLKEMGIELDDFGNETVVVRTVPDFFDSEDLRSVLEEIAEAFRDSEDNLGQLSAKKEIMDKKREVAASLACHRAIRGAEIIGEQEIEVLYKELLKTEDPYHCPHGRPTIIKITIEELMKRFRRK